jgi:methylmalonyl-CoA/ethylmalonyl-CoA epimerase
LTPVIHDHAQQVKVQFWGNSAGPQVELIEPAGPNSPAMASLEKGGGLNHLCYEVENLDEIYSTAREKGSIQVCAPVPAKAFDGRRICFLFDTMLGLIEFVEAA